MIDVKTLKSAFDGRCGYAKLKAIIDYTKEDIIIVYESENAVPGIMFRVNKKTGNAVAFCPAENLIKFSKAAKNRSISF